MIGDRYRRVRERLHPPQGEQLDVVNLVEAGHHVILGTAGSGKTTMAMYRAIYLSDPIPEHGGKTLLVVYNKSLLAWLRQGLVPHDPNLDIINYHRFALGYLRSRNVPTDNVVCEKAEKAGFIHRAHRTVLNSTPHKVLVRGPQYAAAEIAWIARHGITELDEYLAVDRVGRVIGLDEKGRRAIWAVRERYLGLREAAGRTFDWDDIAIRVTQEMAKDTTARRYKHIIIDEAQDFSLLMLRSLVGAAQPGGSITVFGDSAQQIYGHGISWKQAGLKVQRVWPFARNYRNSPQVAALAQAVANMPYYEDIEDMVAPSEFADAGPLPVMRRFASGLAERKWVVSQARRFALTGTTAVLFNRNTEVAAFLDMCPEAEKLGRDTLVWTSEPGIWVGTVHSAKGFEFQSVILSRLNASTWPEPEKVKEQGKKGAAVADGRLLYVGITRSRSNLVMTTTGEQSQLLPGNTGLWQEAR